jgi:hypothetical protein
MTLCKMAQKKKKQQKGKCIQKLQDRRLSHHSAEANDDVAARPRDTRAGPGVRIGEGVHRHVRPLAAIRRRRE